MFRLSQTDFPNLEQSAEGEVVPFIIGRYPQAPGIGVQVGLVDKLRQAMTFNSPTNGESVKLSDPDVVKRLPTAGTLQVGSERITYTRKNEGLIQVDGITRGAQGTQADNHEINTAAYQVLTLHVYILCENPGNHKTFQLTQVYLEGRPKFPNQVPLHTVTLDDRTLVDGHSFVTITFDMSTIPPTTTAPPPAPPRRQVPLARRPRMPHASGTTPPRPSMVFNVGNAPSGSGFSLGAAGWLPLSAAISLIGAPPPPPATTTIYEWPTPILGAVSADIEGLQDDSAGTLTGVALQLIRKPMHHVRILLREAWREDDDADYNLASFNATRARQDGFGLTEWAQRYAGEGFEGWREAVALQGRADLFNESGLWHYLWRERRLATLTFAADDIVGVPVLSWTGRSEVTTVLSTLYGTGQFQHGFALKSDRGLPRFGAQSAQQLTLPWIYDDGPARALAQYWLDQWDRPRLQVSLRVRWLAYVLELGDTFAVDHPTLDPFGRQHVAFLVSEKRYNLADGSIELVGLEADAPALILDESFAVRAPGVGTLTLDESFAVKIPVYKGEQPYEQAEAGLFPQGTGVGVF